MKRNVELLEKTMQHIIDHPETHDQGMYWNYCGTPSCFAGWALHFSGVTRDQVRTHGSGPYAGLVLGLKGDEWPSLFYDKNTRDMLALMVKDLVNGEDLQAIVHYRELAESDV